MAAPEEKRSRLGSCHQMLTARRILINTFLSFFYGLLVTGDETWVCNWDPEGKQESMAYITSRFSVIPNIKDHGKDMGYLPPKTTMKGAYYSEVLVRLRQTIQEKPRDESSRQIRSFHSAQCAYCVNDCTRMWPWNLQAISLFSRHQLPVIFSCSFI